jgi:6-phosphogluconolactonase
MQTINRRQLISLASSSLTAAGLAAAAGPASAKSYDDDGLRSGMVFTSSNAASGNELLVYARGRDGTLAPQAQLTTGGVGSGAGLGSQGAVTISRDGQFLFVVNAGSNTVSTFEVRERGLRLSSVVASGGLHPISLTEADGLVVVLNDGGEGGVAAFRNVRGDLRPIAGAVRGLSVAPGAAPAPVGFRDDGDTLLVTEKGTNRLTSYRVGETGRLGAAVVTASPGQTPFGFAFNRRNRLVVTEAMGGAAGASTVSAYRFSESAGAKPLLVSASVANTQSASCWVSVTPNGRFAYVANTGSSSISSYRIEGDGHINLIAAVAGQTGGGSAPADTAVSPDGRHLFVRNGRSFTISTFAIDHEGTLTAGALLTGLPGTAVGLAAN